MFRCETDDTGGDRNAFDLVAMNRSDISSLVWK